MQSILLSVILLAAPPAIKLPADLKADVGDFVAVRAETAGKVVKFKADPGLSVFPSELLKDTKTTVVVGKRPGTYRVWAWTAVGDEPSELAECTIVIGSSPSPDPPNPPTPPQPDATFSKWTTDTVKALVPFNARSRCRAVADNFRSVSRQIGAGTLQTAQQVQDATRKLNDATLGPDGPAWENWRLKLGEELDKLDALNQFNTPKAWYETWNQIADGLEKASA